MSGCITKGVILAAGDGDRLGHLTSSTPKVLLPVLGRPLISYPLESMARAGIKDIAIVVGYLSERIESALCETSIPGVNLHYVLNRDHAGGNALSVVTAGRWVGSEPFILCMGDHIIDADRVSRFLERSSCRETLGVDFSPGAHHIVEEATKVKLDREGFISAIGKDLDNWDAIDTGIFLLTQEFLAAAKDLHSRRGIQIEISEVIRLMLRRGQKFAVADITGEFWADIDTIDDIRLVDGVAQ